MTSTGAGHGHVRLDVVLPAFNEESNIKRVVTGLLSAPWPEHFEVFAVVVDDGSTDSTLAVAQSLAAESDHVLVVHHEKNIGYGGAVAAGFARAEGEYVAMMDADGQFAVDDLIRLCECLPSSDVVAGVREKRGDPFGRRLLGRLGSMLGRAVFGTRMRDLNSGLKVFRTHLVQTLPLRCTGPGINLEVFTFLARKNCTIREVPVRHLPRTAGKQTGGAFRTLVRLLPESLSVLWRARFGMARELSGVASTGEDAHTCDGESVSDGDGVKRSTAEAQRPRGWSLNLPMWRASLFVVVVGMLGVWQVWTYGLEARSVVLALTAAALGIVVVGRKESDGPGTIEESGHPIGLLLLLCSFGLVARLAYFNGIRGHDDFCYLLYLRQGWHGDYSEMLQTPHGIRLLVMLPLILSVKLFGPSMFAAFFPSVVLSLLQLPLAYAIALRARAGQRVALVAAWCMAIFPLDVFVSTTARGDIEASLMSGLCLLAFLGSGVFDPDRKHSRRMIVWLAATGFLCAMSVMAKPTNWATFAVLFVIGAIDCGRRRRVLLRYAWLVAGAILFFGLQAIFYRLATGNALQQFSTGLMDYTKLEAEGGFRGDPSLRFEFLPALMFDLKWVDPYLETWDVNNYAGYGVFFYVVFLAMLFYPRRVPGRFKLTTLWMLLFLLYLAFGSMNLTHYTPPHKEPRHLSVVTLPVVVLMAAFVCAWLRDWDAFAAPSRVASWVMKSGLGVILLSVTVSSFANVGYHHAKYTEALQHNRELLDFVNRYPRRNFWTHHYLVQFLELSTAYRRPSEAHAFTGTDGLGFVDDTAFFQTEAAVGDFVALYQPLNRYSDHDRLRTAVRDDRLKIVTTWGEGEGSLAIFEVFPRETSPENRREIEQHLKEKGLIRPEAPERVVFAWECEAVDGVDELSVHGRDVDVRHIRHREPQRIHYSFFADVGGADGVRYRLIKEYGRGAARITELPSEDNGSRLKILIDDDDFAGADHYRIIVTAIETHRPLSTGDDTHGADPQEDTQL